MSYFEGVQGCRCGIWSTVIVQFSNSWHYNQHPSEASLTAAWRDKQNMIDWIWMMFSRKCLIKNKLCLLSDAFSSGTASLKLKITFPVSGIAKKTLCSHFVAWQSCQAVFVNLNWTALQQFDPFETGHYFDGHYESAFLLYWDHIAYCCQLHHASHCYWLLASQCLLHQHK